MARRNAKRKLLMVRASIFNVYFLALILFFFLFIFIACCGGQVESRLNITSCLKCPFWQFFCFLFFLLCVCPPLASWWRFSLQAVRRRRWLLRAARSLLPRMFAYDMLTKAEASLCQQGARLKASASSNKLSFLGNLFAFKILYIFIFLLQKKNNPATSNWGFSKLIQ